MNDLILILLHILAGFFGFYWFCVVFLIDMKLKDKGWKIYERIIADLIIYFAGGAFFIYILGSI